MAEKDKTEKVLEDYNDVLADIYNTLLFSEPYLKETGLTAGPTESIYKTEMGEAAEQRRDVLKHYGKAEFVICSMGIENQSTIDRTMPVRIMGYDYATYREQLSQEQKPTPVITIVLNFSNTRWNGSKSLHEMFDIPEKLKLFVQNYQIQVFDIAFLDDEVIERFTSDFKIVAKFFKARRLGLTEIFLDDKISLEHVEAVLYLFEAFTGDNRYWYSEELGFKVRKGEMISMCDLAESIEQKGIQKGLEEGIKLGGLKMLKNLLDNKVINEEEAAGQMNVSVEELTELFAGLQKV